MSMITVKQEEVDTSILEQKAEKQKRETGQGFKVILSNGYQFAM